MVRTMSSRLIAAMFASVGMQQPVREKKPRVERKWRLTEFSAEVLGSVRSQNKLVDTRKREEVIRRIGHKKRLAEKFIQDGRPGKARKLLRSAHALTKQIGEYSGKEKRESVQIPQSQENNKKKGSKKKGRRRRRRHQSAN